MVLLITTLINILTTAISWQRRKTKDGLYFAWGMIAVTLWTFASALDYAAVPISLKIFFARIEYIGYNSALALFALFGLSFAGYDDWLKKKWVKAIIFLIPTINILLAWTNDLHNLLWLEFARNEYGDNLVVFTHGPGFTWVSVTGYILVAIIVVSLWQASRRGSELTRRQARLLFLATCIPIAGNIIYLFGIREFGGIDFSALLFSISGLFFLIALYGTRFMDLAPIARHTMIEKMADGVLVLDSDNRIVDFNLAAQGILNIKRNQLNNPAGYLLAQSPAILELVSSATANASTATITHEGSHRIFETQSTPLVDDRSQLYGKLLVFRDITEHYRVERALGERVKELKSIFDLSLLVETPGISYDEILQASVQLISAAMQYPEIAYARLEIGNQVFVTDNFQETPNKIAEELLIAGKKIGMLQAGYLVDVEKQFDLTFLEEEKNLLFVIAESWAGSLSASSSPRPCRRVKSVIAPWPITPTIGDIGVPLMVSSAMCPPLVSGSPGTGLRSSFKIQNCWILL